LIDNEISSLNMKRGFISKKCGFFLLILKCPKDKPLTYLDNIAKT
jgi:hypothetical protein